MASIEELRKERQNKRRLIEDAGKDVYPISTQRTHSVEQITQDFSGFSDAGELLWIAGRILSVREHGSVVFFDIFDGTDEIQVVLKEDEVEPEADFELFVDAVDIGDFVEVKGVPDTTRTGQESIMASQWDMLAKAIRPIPTQWDGLEDTETRLRKRYIDILMNDEARDLVEKRSQFWRAIREFMEESDFLEVQTPILETTPGGADARAFKSHHNALDMDVYLRISAGELWQKRLLVAGFEKVFEVGRVFRNEGISAEHAQDYMQMEFYWAYADHEDGMEFTRDLYRHIAKETFDTLTFSIRGHEVDLGKEWQRIDYVDTVKEKMGVDIKNASLEEVKQALDENGINYDEDINKVRAVDILWKRCRKQISGPGFLVNVPKSLSPLAKTSDEDESTVAQFQPIIAGSEVGKGYSELNDPREQAKRFEKQEELRKEGDEEAQRFDHDFVEALEHGMPPACGFGVSERLFAFLMDLPIREAQIFPLLKPKE